MINPRLRLRALLQLGGATLVHAALTLGLYFLYMKTAFEIDHGVAATPWTTIGQSLKVAFLYPLALPVLKLRPDLLSGWRGGFFLLINSLLWMVALVSCRRFLRNRRARR